MLPDMKDLHVELPRTEAAELYDSLPMETKFKAYANVMSVLHLNSDYFSKVVECDNLSYDQILDVVDEMLNRAMFKGAV